MEGQIIDKNDDVELKKVRKVFLIFYRILSFSPLAIKVYLKFTYIIPITQTLIMNWP